MEQNSITLPLVREALVDVLLGDEKGESHVYQVSDDRLLSIKLKEDLDFDSLDFVELTMYLEKKSDVVFPDNIADYFQGDMTVSDFLIFCQNY